MQENRERYPTIFVLAMDILPIQASAVPCERIFSSAKETMALRRNRISGDLMEALQMLKFAVRQGSLLNFTDGLDWNEEVAGMETCAEREIEVPEDANLYRRTMVVT
jgi:hypothetical protein